MTSNAVLTVAPLLEPVSLADAKAQVRFGSTAEDSLILAYISAARGLVEEMTNRALLTQTWRLDASGFSTRFWLPRAAPVQSVTHVKYYDTTGTLQTLSSSVYRLQTASEPAFLELVDGQTVPTTAVRSDAVQITYVVGYSSAAEVPAALRQACLLLVSHYFANREPVVVGSIATALPLGVEALCGPWQVVSGAPGDDL